MRGVLMIYDELESPNEGGVFKIDLRYMMNRNRQKEGSRSRYMMNRNRQRGGVFKIDDVSESPNGEGGGCSR